jgi:hypothetical protein
MAIPAKSAIPQLAPWPHLAAMAAHRLWAVVVRAALELALLLL